MDATRRDHTCSTARHRRRIRICRWTDRWSAGPRATDEDDRARRARGRRRRRGGRDPVLPGRPERRRGAGDRRLWVDATV